MFLKALLLATAVLAAVHQTNAATDKIVCFFASWAGYRNGDGSFKPNHIDAEVCTHVFYAFLGVEADGSIKMLDPWNEVDLGGLQNTAALKQRNPNLKVMISIGGWNAGPGILQGIVASSKLRQSFINSCIAFFRQWNFDGIDIDWEYPQDSDKANFVKLLQEMQTAFASDGYVLSVTVGGTVYNSYDVPQITKVVDLVNIMSYDYHTTDQGRTGHNSPLYGNPSVNTTVHNWLNAGVDANKLTLSVPFYGHTFSLTTASHEVGAPANIGIAGPYTQSPGTLGYYEICEYYSDWTQEWDDAAQAPYAYDGTNWVSYDDPKSIGLKAKFAVDNGMAGIAVWSVDTDDFHGNCGTAYPLMRAIQDNLS